MCKTNDLCKTEYKNIFRRALEYFMARPIVPNNSEPGYVYPSKRTLEQLEAGLKSAREQPHVYRDEDFSKYADDE